MKNELMARAMSHIDNALIEEANESPSRSRVINPDLLSKLTRYGSMAACMMLVLGAVLLGTLRGPEVLLYGEEVTAEARMINEYIPRAVTYSVSPAEASPSIIPMELEFKRSTRLTSEACEMIVLDNSGEVIYQGNEYLAEGETSLCLSLPDGADSCVIATDRGYKIVLNKDLESGLWYVNIEK
jgi:hypothetical protein